MTYSIVWEAGAVDAASRFLDDPEGLRRLLDAIDTLAENPRPEIAAELGSADLRRLRVGRYRVLYEVLSATEMVTVFHIGRIG